MGRGTVWATMMHETYADNVSSQLGQLFMMGFDGTTINDQIRTLVSVYHVGSILLSAKNLECAVLPFLSCKVACYAD